MSAIGIIIEKLVTFAAEDGYRFFNIKSKRDEEGHVYVWPPPSYHVLTVLLFLMFLFCFVLLVLNVSPHEFWLAAGINVFLLSGTILSYLYVQNTYYKFNKTEIIRQNLFKKHSTIFWNDCSFKPLNIWTKQITIYNHESTFRISSKFIDFRSLVYFLETKRSVTRRFLGVYDGDLL